MKPLVFLIFISASLAGAAPVRAESMWIASNGFHSSIGIRARDWPLWRERDADEILIGWGDAQWYRGHVNAAVFCSAVFWPTPSLLHVVPVRGAIARKFSHSDVVRLELSHAQFQKLTRELAGSFARDARGRPVAAGPGFAPRGRFYAGRETFYFPKMCNYWLAEKLQKAGLPFSPLLALTASGLMHQAARIGVREQSNRKPADAF